VAVIILFSSSSQRSLIALIPLMEMYLKLDFLWTPKGCHVVVAISGLRYKGCLIVSPSVDGGCFLSPCLTAVQAIQMALQRVEPCGTMHGAISNQFYEMSQSPSHLS
jgi:hypothetical protein